jgi:hypothetical protein
MVTEHTYFGERGSVSTRLLLTETPTVSTLLPISSAPLLALVLTVTNDSADMPTTSYLRGRSVRLLTGMLAVSTFFSLRRVLFLVLAVIDSVDKAVSLSSPIGTHEGRGTASVKDAERTIYRI